MPSHKVRPRSVKVRDDVWERFCSTVNYRYSTPSGVIRMLIMNYLVEKEREIER